MKYKVRIIRLNQPDQYIECKDLHEAERTLEDLKSAFPKSVRTGEMSVLIVEEDE